MKEDIKKLFDEYTNNDTSFFELEKKVLDLVSVSVSLDMKVSELKFIPEKPYVSDVISWEKGNLWELHELFPEEQNIKVVINKITTNPLKQEQSEKFKWRIKK